jgi:CBS domain-containing protein
VRVREVMTTSVISVRPDEPLKEVARKLSDNGISGVPVVDELGRVQGVVSEADFLMKEQDAEHASRSRFAVFDHAEGQQLEAKLHATTAAQSMSRPAITIDPDATLRLAATSMTRNRVNRLPVLADGRLIGIVTRADLVKTFLVADEDLRTRVVKDVLHDTMWMREDEVAVEVQEGVVSLRGVVDRRSTATILERLVRHTDGVVDVDSQLTWELDDRALQPVGDLEHEPTSASVTARERPRR